MTRKIIFITAGMFALLIWLKPAAAAPVNTDYLFGGDVTNVQKLSEQSGLGLQDPRETAAKVVNVTLGFLGIIAVVLILIAGFLWMTAAGSEEKIATAKKLMSAGVIGLVIVLAAFGIARFVISSMLSATGGDSVVIEEPRAPGKPEPRVAAETPPGAQLYGSGLSAGGQNTDAINNPENPVTHIK